jgi:hypothetical protein
MLYLLRWRCEIHGNVFFRREGGIETEVFFRGKIERKGAWRGGGIETKVFFRGRIEWGGAWRGGGIETKVFLMVRKCIISNHV